MKRTPGTATNKLIAIRHQHIVRGIPDPLCDKQRVFIALHGAERLAGSVARKLPVTPGMMEWKAKRFWGSPNDTFIVYAHNVLAFFFGFRKSGTIGAPGAE